MPNLLQTLMGDMNSPSYLVNNPMAMAGTYVMEGEDIGSALRKGAALSAEMRNQEIQARIQEYKNRIDMMQEQRLQRQQEMIASLYGYGGGQGGDFVEQQPEFQPMSGGTPPIVPIQDEADRAIAAARITQDPIYLQMAQIYEKRKENSPEYKGMIVKAEEQAKKEVAAPEKQKAREDATYTIKRIIDLASNLKQSGGIPDPSNTFLENVGAGVKRLPGAQDVGLVLGSNESILADQLEGAKTALLGSAAQASGISASMMNSEREMDNFLRSLGNPRAGIDSVLEAAIDVDRRFGTGQLEKELQQGTPPQAQQAQSSSRGTITEEKIQATMKKYGHTREQGLQKLGVLR